MVTFARMAMNLQRNPVEFSRCILDVKMCQCFLLENAEVMKANEVQTSLQSVNNK